MTWRVQLKVPCHHRLALRHLLVAAKPKAKTASKLLDMTCHRQAPAIYNTTGLLLAPAARLRRVYAAAAAAAATRSVDRTTTAIANNLRHHSLLWASGG
jgi:hypothetical protein